MRTKCPLRVRKADIKNSLSEASFEALPSRLTVHFRDAFIRRANQFWFSAIVSSPKIKIFCFTILEIRIITLPVSRPQEGRIMIVTTRGVRDVMDALASGVFSAGRKRQGVRRSRVVLAPRCWR